MLNATIVGSPPRPPNGEGCFGAVIETVPTTAMEPLVGPPAAGVKVTLTLALCPAFSVCGKVNPDRVKPFPEIAA